MENNDNQTLAGTSQTEPTPMPMIAGIMAIVAGAFKLFGLPIGAAVLMFIPVAAADAGIGRMEITLVVLLVFLPLLVLGVLSIIGGVYAIRRRRYGLALMGAIAALLPFSMLGIASVVLVALSKNEFE